MNQPSLQPQTTPQLTPEQRLIKTFIDLGNTLFARDKFEDAILHYEKVLDERAGLTGLPRARVLYNVGTAHAKLGQKDEAIACYQQALEIQPDFPMAKVGLLRIDYEEANQQKGYEFTQDWFSRNLLIWQEHLQEFVGLENLQFLEIGSWEGRSACWLLEHILTHDSARITCIDSFEGNQEHQSQYDTDYFRAVEPRFDSNMAKTGAAYKVDKRVGKSYEILRSLPLHFYDFAYVDGSHVASDVLSDSVLSWGLVKVGGIMIFDDYDFGLRDQGTRLAIDAFLHIFASKFEVLHKSHQVVIRKTAND